MPHHGPSGSGLQGNNRPPHSHGITVRRVRSQSNLVNRYHRDAPRRCPVCGKSVGPAGEDLPSVQNPWQCSQRTRSLKRQVGGTGGTIQDHEKLQKGMPWGHSGCEGRWRETGCFRHHRKWSRIDTTDGPRRQNASSETMEEMARSI